ncbi:MAG: Gfo/Idh/MocA family oxidoreductase [Endomicrobium sp.]|jgi:predicted dehydrogenase|nr:Gfo/Idh/MocA family oxidoreductase [Endomicrobium sp.]
MNIKTAVIGVGSLGHHHARILSQHSKSKLEFVVDINKKTAIRIAKINNTKYLTNYNALVGKIEAAIIAVPTQYHYHVTKFLLQHDIHCLVEKPFTTDIYEAEELVRISKARNLILQVGHIERFNPAIIAAVNYVNNPKFIEVNRLGPYYDSRINNIGVVLDLMIHDLDILFFFMKEKVISFEAYGAKVFSNTEDIAKVRLRYSNGCIADLSASRVSLKKYRKIRIFQSNSYISIDYAKKNLKIYTKKKENINSISDIDVKKPKLLLREPLFYELDNFLTNVINGQNPDISGNQGKNVVKLAIDILKNMIF